MVVAEFIGTFSLASVMLAMVGRTAFPFFLAASAGATLSLMVLIIGSVSGALINPALTVGLWTVRKLDTTRTLVFVAAQMLGGLVAWQLNQYLLDAPLKSLAGDEFLWRVLIAEALGAFVFAYGVGAAIYHEYRGLKYAVTLGLSLSVGIVLATFASNGLLNPAVALGVHSWSLAYVIGPIVGAILGLNVYGWLGAPESRPKSRVLARISAGKTTFQISRQKTNSKSGKTKKRK